MSAATSATAGAVVERRLSTLTQRCVHVLFASADGFNMDGVDRRRSGRLQLADGRTGCSVSKPTFRPPARRGGRALQLRRRRAAHAGAQRCSRSCRRHCVRRRCVSGRRRASQKLQWFGTLRGRIGLDRHPDGPGLCHRRSRLWRGETSTHVTSGRTIGRRAGVAAFGSTCDAGRLDRRRRHRRRDRRQLDRQARISLHRSRHGVGIVRARRSSRDRRRLRRPAATARTSPTTSCASV